MAALAIPYPQIDPILIEIGPLAIRWYALAYIAGLLLGWRYIVSLVRNDSLWTQRATREGPPSETDIDDLLVWATIGVILGGRIGYVLFYGLVYYPEIYLENPINMLKIWNGGMSFHGGLTGVILAIILFSMRRRLDMFKVGDVVAAAAPIGLFFGRLANFFNGELWGKVTNVPWAMVFPNAPDPRLPDLLPRHPSQLYEAALEGVVLFIILRVMTHSFMTLRRPGLVTGAFLLFYGIFRAFVEVFRDSEAFIFSENSGITMGMALSVPMWLAAGFFFWRAYTRRGAPKRAV
jgi:phosphatidylglycerol:prolipoprotein diacylglycerol transferase